MNVFVCRPDKSLLWIALEIELHLELCDQVRELLFRHVVRITHGGSLPQRSFPFDWLRCTETSFFKNEENCLVVETKRDAVLELVRKLKDPEYNLKIGAAGRATVAQACHWGTNSMKFRKLIEAVRSM